MAKNYPTKAKQAAVRGQKMKASGTKAQQQALVRVATIRVPGASPRTYKVSEDDDEDTAYVKYKKEMGIRSSSAEPVVQFTSMTEEDFAALYNEERGHFVRFGRPAAGNVARSEGPTFIDRNLSEEQQELYDEDPSSGEVVPRGADVTPLSDREDASDEDAEEVSRPRALRAAAVESDSEEEEEEEDDEEAEAEDEEDEAEAEDEEEIEVDPDEVKTMKKGKLVQLAKDLGIAKASSMELGKLRKKVLAKIEG